MSPTEAAFSACAQLKDQQGIALSIGAVSNPNPPRRAPRPEIEIPPQYVPKDHDSFLSDGLHVGKLGAFPVKSDLNVLKMEIVTRHWNTPI
jgi:hypothetical protein